MQHRIDDTIVEVVAAIGDQGFGPAVMRAFVVGTGADMCSAFAMGAQGGEVLIAESVQPDRSPFAKIASLRYASRHWRQDRETLYNMGRAHRSAVLARRSALAINDMDYRHECYLEGEVGERLSVCRAGAVPIILNAYRDASRDRFPPTASGWIEAHAPVLIAAIDRHRRLAAAGDYGTDPLGLLRQLHAIDPTLSPREARVLAHTALGQTRAAIASALGLSVTSIATYRQRGYAKLGVQDRTGLQAILRRSDAALTGQSPPDPLH